MRNQLQEATSLRNRRRFSETTKKRPLVEDEYDEVDEINDPEQINVVNEEDQDTEALEIDEEEAALEAPPALDEAVVNEEEQEDWLTFWSEEPSLEWKARKTTIFMNLFTCYIGVFYDEILT